MGLKIKSLTQLRELEENNNADHAGLLFVFKAVYCPSSPRFDAFAAQDGADVTQDDWLRTRPDQTSLSP
jgi:hypothetical protein